MAAHTTRTGVVIDAFQWNGGIMSNTTTVFPFWTKFLALHTPGTDDLHMRGATGTITVKPGEWVIQLPSGNAIAMGNVSFTALFS